MLPNEILNKIFKYRYHDFKKFLSKIRRVNREYHQKFILNCDQVQQYTNHKNSLYYIFDGRFLRDFSYNFRELDRNVIHKNKWSNTLIFNPNIKGLYVEELNDNY